MTSNGGDPTDEGSVQGSAKLSGDPNYMTSLERGLTVIQAFSKQRHRLSISQISQKTGISRAAVRRCLYTLSHLGFVAAEDERYFVLRPKVLALGHAYLTSSPFASVSMPVLRHVTSVLNESSSIAVLDGADILYIARAPTSRIMTIELDVGSRLPAYCTSMGRVMLWQLSDDELEARLKMMRFLQYTANTLTTPDALKAELNKVSVQGFALIDQELGAGLRSVAIPIVNSRGVTVAATCVAVHESRVTVGDMKLKILPVLREAAQELSLLAG
ncbi:helix-turn-helix domain-containing protein [Caballeronia sp. SEWSISQ10-4 2]|uniref:IclR family transcriptional regulator domain-containing protein n=1 Tax=Caballeronia sp. SEWSISQ10-4 2 TaxID=2937438 RepID=UPI00264C8ADC|nr:IclR family transcriptional regulator C-terminal domain-containing protein [Caballeronia sp. SEWSISQ10-4 2]MDN7179240.1 helix-turn-helix domain-containing protein [Caballeronia sp. SEWSISQ10-4 2]